MNQRRTRPHLPETFLRRESSRGDSGPTLSVLIPTLDEARWLEHCVQSVRASMEYGGVTGEVVVCDGGSGDATPAVAERLGVEIVRFPRANRARQLNAAAERASGEVYALLHADSVVPPDWAPRIEDAIEGGSAGGWCRVDIAPESASWIARLGLRMMTWGVNRRTRLFRTATGDQSIFVRADLFEAMDGLPELPLLEGARFASALRRRGPVEILDQSVRISGRRWERGGPIRTMLLMFAIRGAFHLGVDAERLAAFWHRRGG